MIFLRYLIPLSPPETVTTTFKGDEDGSEDEIKIIDEKRSRLDIPEVLVKGKYYKANFFYLRATIMILAMVDLNITICPCLLKIM